VNSFHLQSGFSGIQQSPVLDPQKVGQPMSVDLVFVENVKDFQPADRQRIRDEPTMALPPQPLGGPCTVGALRAS